MALHLDLLKMDYTVLNYYFHQIQAPTQVLGPEYCYLEPPSDIDQLPHLKCITQQAKIIWTEKISEIPYEAGFPLMKNDVSNDLYHCWNINKVVNTQKEKGIQKIPTLNEFGERFLNVDGRRTWK